MAPWDVSEIDRVKECLMRARQDADRLNARVDELLEECTRQRKLCREMIEFARSTGYLGLAEDFERRLARGSQR